MHLCRSSFSEIVLDLGKNNNKGHSSFNTSHAYVIVDHYDSVKVCPHPYFPVGAQIWWDTWLDAVIGIINWELIVPRFHWIPESLMQIVSYRSDSGLYPVPFCIQTLQFTTSVAQVSLMKENPFTLPTSLPLLCSPLPLLPRSEKQTDMPCYLSDQPQHSSASVRWGP